MSFLAGPVERRRGPPGLQPAGRSEGETVSSEVDADGRLGPRRAVSHGDQERCREGSCQEVIRFHRHGKEESYQVKNG